MCFSSEVIIAAVEANNSGAFTKVFEVTSNNISVECAFIPVNTVKFLGLNIPWIGPEN